MGEAFFCASELESNSCSRRVVFKRPLTCLLCREECERTNGRQLVCPACRPAYIRICHERHQRTVSREVRRAYLTAYRRRQGIHPRKRLDHTPAAVPIPLRKVRAILAAAGAV